MFFGLLDAKPCRTIMKFIQKLNLDPKRAKLNQDSDFGQVRTYSWLHKVRNTQRKIHGTYLGNIFGIYKECIRNIHKHIWYKIITNTDPPHWAPPVFVMILYHKYLWIFLIHSLYIPHIFPRYVPYISFVCFLIYGVKSRSGHDRSPSFGSISHVSDPKQLFEVIS